MRVRLFWWYQQHCKPTSIRVNLRLLLLFHFFSWLEMDAWGVGFFSVIISFFLFLKIMFFCFFYLYPLFLLPSHKTHTTLLVDISLVWMHSISCDFNDWLTLREILKCKMMKNCKKNYYTTKFWSLKEVKKNMKKKYHCVLKKPFFDYFKRIFQQQWKQQTFWKKLNAKILWWRKNKN